MKFSGHRHDVQKVSDVGAFLVSEIWTRDVQLIESMEIFQNWKICEN